MSLPCPDCGAADHRDGSRFCYACGAELPTAPAAARAPRPRSEIFVGREDDLAQLERLVGQARSRRLTYVELRGDAGIGKTRLVAEVVHRLLPEAAVLRARCRAGGAMRAYALWMDLLRRWDPRRPGADRAAAVQALISASGDRRAAGREEIADAVFELLSLAAREVRERLLPLVFDDLHWADPSSLFVLRRLLEKNADAPILILATARPELPPEWAASRMIERLELGPLSSFDCGVLARALLDGLPGAEELAGIARERAGGNPLFLEHVCGALLEGSEELRVAARVEASLRRARVRLPESLRAVVDARLQRCSESQRRVLAVAALVGGRFAPELIARTETELPAAQLEADLDELVARGLLARGADGLLDFPDDLLAESAYDALPHALRRTLHRRFADMLAEAPGSDTPERWSQIGDHYDRARATRQAAPFLARAGIAFLELFAPAEAAMHLRRVWALQHGGVEVPDRERAMVGLALATALGALDRQREAGAILEALDPEDFSEADRVAAGATFIQGGWAQFGGRNARRGRDLVQRGLSLVDGKPGGELHTGMALAFLARIDELDGEARAAIAHAERMLEGATAAGNLLGQVVGFVYAADARCDLGELARAFEDARNALQIADSGAGDLARAIAYSHAAKVYLQRGDPAGALRAARIGRRAAEAGGRQEGALSHCAFLSGYAHLALGEPEPAAREFETFAALNPGAPSTLDHCGRFRLELGQLDQAVDLTRKCVSMDPPRLVRIRALRTLALALGRGEPAQREEAERAALESLELAERLGLRPHVAAARLALAELALRRGDPTEARAQNAQARAIYEACGMPAPPVEALDG